MPIVLDAVSDLRKSVRAKANARLDAFVEKSGGSRPFRELLQPTESNPAPQENPGGGILDNLLNRVQAARSRVSAPASPSVPSPGPTSAPLKVHDAGMLVRDGKIRTM